MSLSQPKQLVSAFTLALSIFASGAGVAANVADAPEAPSEPTASQKIYNAPATAKLLEIVNKVTAKNKAEQVRQQLKLGADPNANDGEALKVECGFDGELNVINVLLEAGADPSLNFGASIKQATIRGDLPAIKAIIRTGKIDPHFQEEALLIYAAIRGYPDIVEYYVNEQKMNPNGFDNSGKVLGNTAKAIFENWPEVDKARYKETLRRLIKDLHADIHINDDAALMTAVEYGVISGTQILLDLGANINARGGAALRMALSGGRVHLAELLLKDGEIPDTPDILYDLDHPENFSKPEQKAVLDLIQAAIKGKEAKTPAAEKKTVNPDAPAQPVEEKPVAEKISLLSLTL
jgi:hypothetical protein